MSAALLADTYRLIAAEDAVVAGRAPFTVFKWGSRWAYVHWSRRPSNKESNMLDAIANAREEREMYGLQEWPITVEF